MAFQLNCVKCYLPNLVCITVFIVYHIADVSYCSQAEVLFCNDLCV